MSVLLVNGNSLSIPLADRSVHCIVTSPPYWSLRDYGVDGQLGLERTPEEYVTNMVAVFRECWRVLRDDGTLWCNLGDSYAANQKGGEKSHPGDKSYTNKGGVGINKFYPDNGSLKPKDLVGIPWRVAFTLQADGWYLRSDIIWSKPNPMPESVTDRPTKSHEYLFLLTKKARYYYDAEAVREDNADPERTNYIPGARTFGINKDRHDNDFSERAKKNGWNPGRNRRTVWTIPTAPYSGAHFATYPPALVEPCIKAGTSERGACPICGAPLERVVSVIPPGKHESEYQTVMSGRGNGADKSKYAKPSVKNYEGWQPTCDHNADPVPCTVFDPFVGSGTTLLVARQLGRHGVGLDLSFDYLSDQARTRLSMDALDEWQNGKDGGETVLDDLPLFQEAK